MIQDEAFVRHLDDLPWFTYPDQEPVEGNVRWKSFVNRDHTKSHGLNIGMMEFPPGKKLRAHHHSPQEVYWVYQGHGELTLGDELIKVKAGTVVYIPENCIHGIKSLGPESLRFLWIFPTDTHSEVQYNYVESE